MIYLDYAATTPISDEALEVYHTVSRDYFGNSQSLHDIGAAAHDWLRASRQSIAEMINGEENGVYFTSGGTEGNHLAILSLAKAQRSKGRHIISTKAEHSSVVQAFNYLQKEGFDISFVPVNAYGIVEIENLEKLITDETILVSLSHVNGETGVIQNIEEIGAFLRQHDILFHSDCVQSFGKHAIDVKKAHVTSVTISSHKIYGPKGVGAVYISPETRWEALFTGITHENGFRAGTVNVPGIAAFAIAAEQAFASMETENERAKRLRERFLSCMMKNDIVIEGHPEPRFQSPHILGLRLKGIEGQYAMLECNRQGIAISTGSTCQINQQTPSKTMLALGRTEDEAREFIRISFGKNTSEEDCEKAANCLNALVKNRRVMQ